MYQQPAGTKPQKIKDTVQTSACGRRAEPQTQSRRASFASLLEKPITEAYWHLISINSDIITTQSTHLK